MTKRKRIKRLSKEQREAAWKPIETNAGMGWTSRYGSPADPLDYERGKPVEYDPWEGPDDER
jgi:hypothetical protein